MSIKKTLGALTAGALLAGTAVLAVAGPASAVPQGPALEGKIYWFNAPGELASQSAATQIWSGSNAVNRPWQALAVDAACPAGSDQMQPFVRVPQAGVPEDDWIQIPLSASTITKDALGRFYTGPVDELPDRLNKPDVLSYLATAPGNTGQFPLVVSCFDGPFVTGHFRTLMTITGTTVATLAWSIPKEDLPLAASTTTIAANPTSAEAGSPVELTATVDPAAATGDVEFFAGATSLGVATISGGSAVLTTSSIPVGTNAVTAQYLGGSHAASTSEPVSVEISAVAARPTVTTLEVDPVSGPAYAQVDLTATVTAGSFTPAGSVTFRDGSLVLATVVCDASGVATFSTTALGAGAHTITADFVGTAPYENSSDSQTATYELAGAVDDQTVTVDIPVGAITITTPYTPSSPLHLGTALLDPADSTYSASAAFDSIVITDSRAGNLGFTASVVSGAFINGASSFPGSHAGLTDLAAEQVVGNALQHTNVVLTDHAPFTDGLGTPKVFAAYAAGQSIGTAQLHGTFGIDGVPTSVTPGLYTATVTFTAI